MKLLAIIFIILGLLGVVANIIIIPSLQFPEGNDQAYNVGYYVGAFGIAIIGIILFFIGWAIYRNASKRQRMNSGKVFELDQSRNARQ